MSQGKYPTRIRYEYEQDPDTRLRYAHGVWGGINPQGEVEMNFYLESDKLPPFSERIVAPDGSFGHEVAPYDEDVKVITRHIHSKLILNYHSARAILEWLEDKVETLEMEEEGAPLMYDGDAGLEQ
ncbi:hypothetical protein [Nitratidesulfovibrio vulgaris]|jgi:hypothetical protein|uniref:Uncharacterized protein n=2 Tax=Nitratidesulfovibrio vulgaris TaxID=881 RepID=Q72CV9_NITV2|nr:hypothetical protein [Nitratidesulfovibrio vulgaris]GEB78928.1 hypothetical protein DDE01_03430 [Desulfovibrio desulfuricans]HBW16553.1 hypothetical protein [Desulfovibrio sp.]AAS95652.1 hypothetical protein DVU_1174 [Nitratidesulfovibrio vulgaris str. Hildenborough]ABM28898.1 conserved hypothetical protein [Nitratidesulfovibrio vulgaris DP4]ADP86245.1 hypothetical protein Deval_1084 [Nitratidesulfovibrio vulgaris RCH1]